MVLSRKRRLLSPEAQIVGRRGSYVLPRRWKASGGFLPYALGALILVANVAACADEGGGTIDAGGDLPPPAYDINVGEASGSASIDFVVQGCSSLDDAHCTGPAPLSLRLTLVTSHPELLSAGRWSFGDGSEAVGATAAHSFDKPGRYTVTVAVGTPDGTLVAAKKDFVVVEPVVSGGACASDGVCASGHCLCHEGDCPAPLDTGLCYRSCESVACPEGDRCVLLGEAGAHSAPWRRDACYPGCTNDTQCLRSGFLCRLAPTRGGSWRRVCLPPFPGDIGHPCRRDDGGLDAGACLGDL
ncbi:MAG: PKD domain-containing protein, partial [Deltaproteobacteria bacterium]|nr:PKD domain-containing protein [Deltaproteobacteria bacterium]